MQTARITKSATFGASQALKKCAVQRPVRGVRVTTRAGADTNLFVNLIGSAVAGAAVTAVVIATSENRDEQIEKVQTLDGAIPFASAVLIDAVAHSIPGLNVLLGLLAEPAGAAAGVAYMFSLVLSAPSVDPATLAPEGTVINAKKAEDSRGFVRVPFAEIVPTLLKVVDTTNDASSGAGWTIGKDGTPKLPINSVLLVLGIGGLILEAAAHAPVLSLLLPRVLSVAGWLAAVGYVLNMNKKN
ncbi:hypothetical protein Ndes2526B_g01545 [Nannochloris sp. 'desiccata']|nr:hypothetical protein KSW81_005946 [Chlorella desiccata (nom. nud.)]KAH7623131.1 hypothetical protein NADE_002325 [Chlorella desiccata (nom. nud.)]